MDLLRKINKELKITILFVTHQIQVIQQLCNKVAVMELGKVVESGSVLDVFSDPQQPMTKKFVRTVIPDTIPKSIQEKLKKETRPYKLLKLRFLGEPGFGRHHLGTEPEVRLADGYRVCQCL